MSGALSTDVLIVGGGVGGCAAALAVCEAGRRVILSEESPWIGGQFTSQGVPADEHGWIEQFGCTARYRRLRNLIREYYRSYYPLTHFARLHPYLNPGNGWVSPLCAEPRCVLAVLESMLEPYEVAGHLRILRHHCISSLDIDRDHIRAALLYDSETGVRREIEARFFLDASELGDALPLAGAEYVSGVESQAMTGEPGAPLQPEPRSMQAFTWCFAVDYLSDEDHTIERPRDYDFWRNYRPRLSPPWPGPLFQLAGLNPRTLAPVSYTFYPHGESGLAFSGLWTYRRLLDRMQFAPGSVASDICLVNWPMNDYMEGDLLGSAVECANHLHQAQQQSLSLLYWLQTEAPRPKGGYGWRGLRPRGDVLGTTTGLALRPYIRESRRIRAIRTVTEVDVSAVHRSGTTRAIQCRDSVGVGYYRIDLHPSSGGHNYVDVPALPFQIPLGSLIPVRIENLLAAGKTVGVTHITNGCFRVHPVEWNIGEAAGALAAYCLHRGMVPRSVLAAPGDFQDMLFRQGVQLAWPAELNLDGGEPHVHAMPARLP